MFIEANYENFTDEWTALLIVGKGRPQSEVVVEPAVLTAGEAVPIINDGV